MDPLGPFAARLAPAFPRLQKQLRIANLKIRPAQFLQKTLRTSLLYGTAFTALSFFILQKARLNPILLLPLFFLFVFMFFQMEFLKIRGHITKRRNEVDREVIFIGRYLLIKLYSGRPLLNALMETSKSRGITAQYVSEIVHDISTGTEMEEALKSAMDYSPSEKFARILFHLNSALKIGVDITRPLEMVLQELTKEEETEIKKYGKKLNTLVIFYMVAAVVIPSLGISLFMVIANFVNIPVSLPGLLIIVFFLIVVEFIFISMFKSIRPSVNL